MLLTLSKLQAGPADAVGVGVADQEDRQRQVVHQLEVLEVARRQLIAQSVGQLIARLDLNPTGGRRSVQGEDGLGQLSVADLQPGAGGVGLAAPGARQRVGVQHKTVDRHAVVEHVALIDARIPRVRRDEIAVGEVFLDDGAEAKHRRGWAVVIHAAIRVDGASRRIDATADPLPGQRSAAADQFIGESEDQLSRPIVGARIVGRALRAGTAAVVAHHVVVGGGEGERRQVEAVAGHLERRDKAGVHLLPVRDDITDLHAVEGEEVRDLEAEGVFQRVARPVRGAGEVGDALLDGDRLVGQRVLAAIGIGRDGERAAGLVARVERHPVG